MSKHLSLISLIIALAAGSAMAAGTTAGTQISNTATATFLDENGAPLLNPKNNQPISSMNPLESNTVTTTVQAVPGFTLTDNTGASSLLRQNIVPGATVYFPYTITNAGNVDGESYTVTNGALDQTSVTVSENGTTITKTIQTPTNVRFYTAEPTSAQLNDPATGTNSLSITGLNAGGTSRFWVAYTVPTSATDGSVYATNPIASRNANTSIPNGASDVPAGTVPDDTNNQNQTMVSRADTGLVGPRDDANADGKVDGTETSVAAYPTADTPAITITPAGDSQASTPNANATVITFINTILNNGNRSDIFNLSTSTTGLPAGSIVQLLDPTSGQTVTNTGSLAADPDGAGTALGGRYSVLVRVTLPVGAVAPNPTVVPTVTLTATSQNALTLNASTLGDTTRNQLNIPGAGFGDATSAAGVDATQVVTKTGDPGGTVQFPMDVYNAGTVTDSFDLTGSVSVLLSDGTARSVTVTYYLADANGNPTGNSITSVADILPGSEAKVVGVVAIPVTAVAGSYTLTQTATSTKTGAQGGDDNDVLKVGNIGSFEMKKFVDNCTQNATACNTIRIFTESPANNQAKPADALRYTIIAKNGRNAVLRNLVLSDTLPPKTTFVSITGASSATGTVLYRVNSGAWSSTAPTTVAAGAKIEVALDNATTSGTTGTIDANDTLPIDTELRFELRVKVD